MQHRNAALGQLREAHALALLVIVEHLCAHARFPVTPYVGGDITGRLIRFTDVREIVKLEPILKAYVYEAVEVEKAGLKVNFKKPAEPNIPEEFQYKLKENPALKTAFYALTPGRQRAYILYFSEPKQPKTRTSRVEKCMKQILRGKGLNDAYLSKRR